jgi:hypothetical protein
MLRRVSIDDIAQGVQVGLECRLVAGGRAPADPRDGDRGNHADNHNNDDEFNQTKRTNCERKSGVPSAAWGGPIGGLRAQKLGGVTLVPFHRIAQSRCGSFTVRRLGSPKPSVSRYGPWLLIALCGLALQEPALASYHFMQIEQVIGGVNGDSAAQAIQLRMRSNRGREPRVADRFFH